MARRKKTESWVGDRLRAAATIFDERNALYGDNYKRFGGIMLGFFPSGIVIKSADDFNRYMTFFNMVTKLTRYAAMFDKGGHPDSLDDNAVYSQMLQELDMEITMNKVGTFK